MALLEVNNLRVRYKTRRGLLCAVDEVNFQVEEGQNVGLIGESGCGKTTVVKSILRLLPRNAEIEGHVSFRGRDLLMLSRPELDEIRWKEIALVPQSAMNALDPVLRIGDQVLEAILAHEETTSKTIRQQVAGLFDLVGLDLKRLNHYPHQFSGGMRQRAIIAMSLALTPRLVIADEPTTGLDVLIQDQILQQIEEIHRRFNVSVLFVTHDIGIVAETCQRIAVMYAGKIVEYADARSLFEHPYHPYTLGLMNAYPSVRGPKRELISIPGSPPDLVDPPSGCRFTPRCPFAWEICPQEEPKMVETGQDNWAACHRVGEIDQLRKEAGKALIWRRMAVNQV
jgi:oligopeptide/dipeptide ABC transporter ATP-binding protein